MNSSLTPEMLEVLKSMNFKSDSDSTTFMAFINEKKVQVMFRIFQDEIKAIKLVVSKGIYVVKQTSLEVPFLDHLEFKFLVTILTR